MENLPFENKQSKSVANLGFIDEKLLYEISERLDINVNELNGMVLNLILESKRVNHEFREVLLTNNKARINEITNLLLDPVNVLGIKPLKKILEELVDSDSDEISSKFEIYENMLIKLLRKGVCNETKYVKYFEVD